MDGGLDGDDVFDDDDYLGEHEEVIAEDAEINEEHPKKKKIKLKLDLKKGLFGDRTIGRGAVKFKINQLPFPLVDPKFHQKVRATGDSLALYLSVVDLFHGLFVLILNFIFYSVYIFTCLGWSNTVVSTAEYLFWIPAFLWPLLYFPVAIPKYLLLFYGSRAKANKKKLILYGIYLGLSILLDVFWVFIFAGGPSGVVKAGIRMTNPNPFFLIALFIFCLGMVLIVSIQLIVNLVIIVLVLIRIIKIARSGVKSISSLPDDVGGEDPGIMQDDGGDGEDWGGVDFTGDVDEVIDQ